MLVVADTHVHIHPGHDLGRALETGAAGLAAAARSLRDHPGDRTVDEMCLLCLTEPAGRRRFEDLREGAGSARAGARLPACRPTEDPEALRFALPGEVEVVLIAGRQVITAERLELLALATLESVPDGLPAATVRERIVELGAVAVLPWSPGKWTLSRRRVVDRLLQSATPGRLLVGDNSLRPDAWPEPAPMRRARRAGLGVVAGSDPLPFPGEEARVGSYGTAWRAPFDRRTPATCLRRLLAAAEPGTPVGTRGSLPTVALRLLRHTARRLRGRGARGCG